MGKKKDEEKTFEFFERMAQVADQLHTRFNSWTQVNLVFGLKSNYKMEYAKRTRCVITPELIEGLQACGYTVTIVPYEETKRSERKKPIKDMSIYDIVKAAEAENLTYGEYVKKYDIY